MEKKDKKNSRSAGNIFRLSPPDLFETLLGEPEDSGYDEVTITKKIEDSFNFACNPESSRKWIAENKE